MRRFLATAALLTALFFVPALQAQVPDVPTMPADPQAEVIYPLRLTAANRGARVGVINAGVTSAYGNLAASPGNTLLVVSTRWENIIPWTLIKDQNVPTAYQVNNLGDHLYLVVDGRRAVRVMPTDNTTPGHVPVRDLVLAKIGDFVQGNLVFEIPAGPYQSLELRFYDFAHGHFTLPLMEAKPGILAELAQAKSATPLAGNEVLSAGIYGVEKTKQIGDRTAPEGMTFVTLDLRAASQFTFDADATAFKPKAQPGERMQIGTVADWTDAYEFAQLVLDGEYAYAPQTELSDLPAEPRFLPDLMTGGRLVFLAPEQFTSMELRADFPNAKTPSGSVIRPKGLTLEVDGKRPEPLPEHAAKLTIDDDIFTVVLTGQEAVDTFAGEAAGEGKRFLVLDVTVTNNNPGAGESFQTPEQLRHIGEAGGQPEAYDPVSLAGRRPPMPLLFIPPGERRSFEVVYRVPASETKPRLSYAGVSRADVFDLEPIAATPVAVATPADVPAEPMDEPGPQPTEPEPQPAQPAQPPVASTPEPAVPDAPATNGPVANAGGEGEKPLKPLKVGDREFPPRVPARPPKPAMGLQGVGLTAEQVNISIDRGADGLWAWLKDDLNKRNDLGEANYHVLVLLALVHSDLDHRDAEFDKVVRQFLSKVDPIATSDTYENGLLCMLIDAYGDPTYLTKLRATAQWFLDTQGPNGTWNYGNHKKPEADPNEVPKRRPLKVSGARPPGEVERPLARLAPPELGFDGDNSTTQYALLGLHAASRQGIKAPADVWARAQAETRRRFNEHDSGWAYTGSGSSYGSMTLAGLCSDAITAFEQGVSDPAKDPLAERGLAWMNANFSVSEHPPYYKERWQYYYLYAMERVGRVLDTEFMGEHEWYPLGARWLIDKQLADGTWDNQDGSEPIPLASSFALLFLTRATPPLEPIERTGPGRLLTGIELPPGLKLHIILDCSGSMLEQMEGRPKFDIAREAVANMVEALPLGSEVALQVYGHRLRATDEKANEDTEIIRSMERLDDESKQALVNQIHALRARGKTPLTASLEEAAKAVRGGSEEEPILVVLLTDGGEDTFPRRDPVAAASKLVETPGVRLFVIGFDIDRNDWVTQLTEMATAGGGSYVPAAEASALGRELRSVVLGAPDIFSVYDSAGKRITAGAFGESRELEPGQYKLRADFSGGRFEQEFWVAAGTTTSVVFDAMAAAEALASGDLSAAPATSDPIASPSTPAEPPAEGSAKKFCTQCGQPVSPAAKFCTSCGQRF